jgi:hypothetical protein
VGTHILIGGGKNFEVFAVFKEVIVGFIAGAEKEGCNGQQRSFGYAKTDFHVGQSYGALREILQQDAEMYMDSCKPKNVFRPNLLLQCSSHVFPA